MEYSTETKDVTLYGFDRDTKELTNPFSYTWVVGTGIAANSTLIKPLEVKSGFSQVFNGNAWVYVEDHRGTKVYSTHTKEVKEITTLGGIPEGFVKESPTSKYDTYINGEWKDIRTSKQKLDDILETMPSLDRRQFKMMLLNSNKLLELENAIDSIEDITVKLKNKIEYEEAQYFKRNDENVITLLKLVNLTDNEITEMWENALTL